MSALDNLLDQIAPARRSASGTAAPAGRVCVLTCSDHGLTPLLEAVDRAEVVFVRLPGPSAGPALERAAAVAVFLQGCADLVVLAHADCTLVRADAAALQAALSQHSIPRAAIPGDLRQFFGLEPNAPQLARESARAIRALPFLPVSTRVHAAVFEPEAGTARLLESLEAPAARASAHGAFEPSGGLPSVVGTGQRQELRPLTPTTGLRNLADGKSASLGTSFAHEPPAAFEPTPFATGPVFETRALENGPARPQASAAAGAALEAPSPQAAPSRPPPIPAKTSPARQDKRPPKLPQPNAAKPTGRKDRPAKPPTPNRPALAPELVASLEKIAIFYRAEVAPGARRSLAQALQEEHTAGKPAEELVRLVVKPLLELGPKRYKVLDELLALKAAASSMDRTTLYQALRHLLE